MKEISYAEHKKKVEHAMGMTVEDFHEKLDDLLTPEYLDKAKEYKAFLDQWLEDGNPIYTHFVESRKELELQDGEFFLQCFDANKPGRNELPIFWFYSNKDNLVSVWTNRITGEKKIIWLPPKEDSDNSRGVQKWKHPITDNIKTIKAYVLGALVFEKWFGLAEKLINDFGTYAFDRADDMWNLNGHHEESCKNNPTRIYDHENILLVDVRSHTLLRDIKTQQGAIRRADPVKAQALSTDLMEEIANVVSFESPDRGVIVWAGESYDKQGNFTNDKGAYAYRYLDEYLLGHEWIIEIIFFADTDNETKEWIVNKVISNQKMIASRINEVLRDQMPYGTFVTLPFKIDDMWLCNLMIIHFKTDTTDDNKKYGEAAGVASL